MWYVARPGQRLGPLSESDFRDLVERGEISASDLLWRPGFSVWLAAEDVLGVLRPPEPTFPSTVTESSPDVSATTTGAGSPIRSEAPQEHRSITPSPLIERGDARDPSGDLPSPTVAESGQEEPSSLCPSAPVSDATPVSIDYFHEAARAEIAARGRDRISAYINAVSRRPPGVPYSDEHRVLLATFLAERPSPDSDAPQSMQEILEKLPSASPEPLHSGEDEARPAEPPRKPARFFITKFWRGEYSLATSYWGFGLLIAVICGAFVGAVSARDPATVTHPNRLVMGMLGAWLLAYAITVWQAVGVWRSALNHMTQTGRKFWAVMAILAVFVGLFRSAGIAVDQGIPQCWALIRIITGHDFGPFVVKEQPGNQIEVAGELSFGVSEKLAEVLAAHPNTRAIRLNSPGGRLGEGKAIRELIRSKHLDTITTGGCDSACVLAFSGGAKRILKFGGHLGFHRPAFPGLTEQGINGEVDEQVRLLAASGMNESFVKKALTTPNDRILRPAATELLAANVITEALPPQRDDVEKLVEHVDLIPVLKKYLPEVYDKFLGELASTLEKFDSVSTETLLNTFAARVSATIGAAMKRNLGKASDEAVRSYARALVRSINELRGRDVAACLAFVEGRVNPLPQFSDEVRRENLSAAKEVLRTASEEPERTPSRGEVADDLAAVQSALRRRFGTAAALLDERPRTKAEQEQKCLVVAAYYEEILALPSHASGRLLRFLYS